MSSIKITQDDQIVCPDCGGHFLHHSFVESTFRDFEDGPGTTAMSYDEGVEVHRAEAESILGSRDVLKIAFWCEQCGEAGGPKTLVLMQDKGHSLIGWQRDEE